MVNTEHGRSLIAFAASHAQDLALGQGLCGAVDRAAAHANGELTQERRPIACTATARRLTLLAHVHVGLIALAGQLVPPMQGR